MVALYSRLSTPSKLYATFSQKFWLKPEVKRIAQGIEKIKKQTDGVLRFTKINN